MHKVHITAQQLLEDSYRLAVEVLKSDFRPNFIVGVWRGGTPVGIAVQELLDFFGMETDHISIRTSSYSGTSRVEGVPVAVHGLKYLIRNVNAEDSLLIVDDVFDTGLSVDSIIKAIQNKARRNAPKDIRVATAYYKPEQNRTQRVPDFFAHQTEEWLVFPHEMKGLSMEEICTNKPGVREIMQEAARYAPRLPE